VTNIWLTLYSCLGIHAKLLLWRAVFTWSQTHDKHANAAKVKSLSKPKTLCGNQ